ncbi:hypothetical protein [Micromonospora haikouensis]|uniref:hypothetical protein n=1 Tax=Micromonospora haikouensis TaxID=686309 RepID=UPI003D715708
MKTTTKRCIPGCDRPATGKGTYPYLCWSHTPEEQDAYPVIVEYTHRHVIWVTADDQAEAVRAVEPAPYELTKDDETLFDAGWKVTAPTDRWDWEDVYEGGYSFPYGDQDCNAHVTTHREHLRKQDRELLEAWVENEDRDQVAGLLHAADRRTCAVCPAWLVPGHTETAYHVHSQRMADVRARREAEALTAV